MTALKPKHGFDWNHVAWGKPDSPRSALCSYCSAKIGEDDVPLIMWTDDSHAAQFCNACMEKWWGITVSEPAYNPDDPMER
jgi:hypothetical protein